MTNIFFIDFETTGLNPYHDYPIEVAIKKIDSEDHYQTLIKPPINGIHYKYVSSKIQSITNINDQMIEESGIQPDLAIVHILKYINKHSNSNEEDIYMIAHNGLCFDFLIFKKLIKDYNNTKRITRNNSLDKYIDRIKFIDSLLLSRLVIKSDSYSQPSLCRRFRINNEQEHRAMGDIKALEELYNKLTLNLSYTKNSNKNIYKNNPYEVYIQTNII